MRIRILVTVLATAFGASAAHAGLINGGFDTGDLTGWTTFTTTNGTLGGIGSEVVAFDTNGDGTADPAARFRVGQDHWAPSGFEGGGIRQSVTLGAGAVTLSADVAAWAAVWGNNSGGVFELLFDGAVVASHDFGFIPTGDTKRATLWASFEVAGGLHDVGLLMRRPFPDGDTTPLQLVDNFSLRGGAVDVDTFDEPPLQAPEPGSLSLLGLGLLGLARARQRRHRQQARH